MVQFPDWTTRPIPGVELSAGGLLVLADLSTIAKRTAIAGSSSWLDSFVLAPGLHYQQAADELARLGWSAAIVAAAEEQHQADGEPATFRVNNAATALYIQRIARPGQTVHLDVGSLPTRTGRTQYRLRRSESGLHATLWAETDIPDLGWISHVLYLVSPILTVAALVFTILFQDWWTLGLLLALMLSRILNIWVIKQRASKPRPGAQARAQAGQCAAGQQQPGPKSGPPDGGGGAENCMTEYTISFGPGNECSVKLRGLSEDVQAITRDAWLRSKTYVEGYLEATAKVLVFTVAALSGNMTQAGAIVMMGLLLVTAGLLALSNANAQSFKINGKVAAPQHLKSGGKGGRLGHGGGAAVVADGGGVAEGDMSAPPPPPPLPPPADDVINGRRVSRTWPNDSSASGMDDWAEKGQMPGHAPGGD